jgi:hypothetical protein
MQARYTAVLRPEDTGGLPLRFQKARKHVQHLAVAPSQSWWSRQRAPAVDEALLKGV